MKGSTFLRGRSPFVASAPAPGQSEPLVSSGLHWRWIREGNRLCRPLKRVFGLVFAAALLVFVIGSGLQKVFDIGNEFTELGNKTGTLLLNQKKIHTDGMERTLLAISVNHSLVKDFLDRNRPGLYQQARPLFYELNDQHQVSRLNFLNTNGQVVLGINEPKPEGSQIARTTVRDAMKNQDTSNGLEYDASGALSLHVVRPWKLDGRLIGFLEIAMEIRKPLDVISHGIGADLVEAYYATPDVPAEARPANQKNSRYILRGVSGKPIPTKLRTYLDSLPIGQTSFQKFLITNNCLLVAHSMPLPDVNGRIVGQLIAVRDITGSLIRFAQSMLIMVLLVVAIAVTGGLFFNIVVRRLQMSVERQRQQLEDKITDRSQKLDKIEARFKEAQLTASIGNWEWDLETQTGYWSDGIYDILGLDPEKDIPTLNGALSELIPDQERVAVKEIYREAIRNCTDFDLEHSITKRDGETRYFYVKGRVTGDGTGRAKRITGATMDITERKKQQARTEQLVHIVETTKSEIYVFDANTCIIAHANQRSREHTGFSIDEITQLPVWALQTDLTEETFRGMIAPLVDGETDCIHLDAYQQRKDGSKYPAEIQMQMYGTDGSPYITAFVLDVSERKKREELVQHAKEQAERLAYFDELTGLPNRAACQRDAKGLFAKDNEQKPAFVIHLDLDNFKRINDTLGHSAGDACLQEAGKRLKAACDGNGRAYRWGGDEFVIMAPDSITSADRLCSRIAETMATPMTFGSDTIWPTISIGVARCPCDAADFETLMVYADLALYRSKEDGKNRWNFFTTALKTDSDEEARLEAELRLAIERDELFLVYQPQVDIRTHTVTGVEALLRWQHPERGVLAPGTFLPVIEKTNMSPVVGRLVLEKALAAARTWEDNGLQFGRIGVNLSPAHLHAGTLLRDVHEAMAQYGIGPEKIAVEVLESVFLNDASSNKLKALEELHNLGIHIDLDDFGTGFASLSHLADLPIDGLKIDRSFTNQMLEDRKKEILVTSLVHLARALDIRVVCEGVETQEQFERLRMMGSFSAQGYLIARPTNYGDFTRWLNETPGDLWFRAG